MNFEKGLPLGQGRPTCEPGSALTVSFILDQTGDFLVTRVLPRNVFSCGSRHALYKETGTREPEKKKRMAGAIMNWS